MHIRATKHFQYSLLDPQRKEKKRKVFTRGSSQQVKEEQEIFLGFLFNYYYNKQESKLAKTIFLVFLKDFSNTQEESIKRKIN